MNIIPCDYLCIRQNFIMIKCYGISLISDYTKVVGMCYDSYFQVLVFTIIVVPITIMLMLYPLLTSQSLDSDKQSQANGVPEVKIPDYPQGDFNNSVEKNKVKGMTYILWKRPVLVIDIFARFSLERIPFWILRNPFTLVSRIHPRHDIVVCPPLTRMTHYH